MPIYPPRNTATKKKQILTQRVYEYVICIETNSTIEKLKKKAEKVKIAKLNLLKAYLVTMRNYDSSQENDSTIKLRDKYEKEMKRWESISFNEIDEFCKITGYE
jgi:hypothetical protein